MSFSRKLKSWRLYRGINQEELSLKSGIPRPNLVALEQGRRECTLPTLYRLAHALGITPGTIVDKFPPYFQKRRIRTLNRYLIDRIARNLLTGKGPLPASLVPLRNVSVRQLQPLLRLAGVKRRIKGHKNYSVPSTFLDQVALRVTKLLPSFIQGVSL